MEISVTRVGNFWKTYGYFSNIWSHCQGTSTP